MLWTIVVIILILLVAMPGCTAQHYRRSADAQVNKILGDRTKTTLGYTPQVEAETSVPTTAPCMSDEIIP